MSKKKVYQAVIDERTCDFCRARHGLDVPDSMIDLLYDGCYHVEAGDICRCAFIEREKSTLEAMQELREAIIEVFLAYCKIFRIDVLVRGLNDLLKSKSSCK